LCCQRCLGFRKIAKITLYLGLYTAGCVYAFENYTDCGPVAAMMAGSLIGAGNGMLYNQVIQ
jgi:hypothetical protein